MTDLQWQNRNALPILVDQNQAVYVLIDLDARVLTRYEIALFRYIGGLLMSISMGEGNTVVSAYTTYRHLQQYCSHPSIYFDFGWLVPVAQSVAYRT